MLNHACANHYNDKLDILWHHLQSSVRHIGSAEPLLMMYVSSELKTVNDVILANSKNQLTSLVPINDGFFRTIILDINFYK